MLPRNPFWPKHAFVFFGSPSPPTIQQQPIPTPAPPVTSDSQQVLQAQQALQNQLGQQKTVKKTIFAGDVAYSPAGSNVAGQPGGAPGTGYKT